MAIDTAGEYVPEMNLPVYLKLTPPEQNSYELMKKYDVRIPDAPRQEEKGGSGPYNYIHECILVGKTELEWREVPDVLLAVLGHTVSRSDAVETVCVGEGEYEDDRELLLLSFLRLDRAQEFVQNGEEVIEPPFTVEDYEGNGGGRGTN